MEELEDVKDETEETDESAIAGINITPLVDVALTLVLVFMVTMPLSMLHGISVRRQTLERYGLSTPQENVRVKLASNGIFVKDARGTDRKVKYEEFGAVLSGMIQNSAKKRLLLECERAVPHGQTVWAMDLAKQNGAVDISLMGAKR